MVFGFIPCVVYAYLSAYSNSVVFKVTPHGPRFTSRRLCVLLCPLVVAPAMCIACRLCRLGSGGTIGRGRTVAGEVHGARDSLCHEDRNGRQRRLGQGHASTVKTGKCGSINRKGSTVFIPRELATQAQRGSIEFGVQPYVSYTTADTREGRSYVLNTKYEWRPINSVLES